MRRFHGLDVWRVVLLLMGPIIHASGLVSLMVGGRLWLDVIAQSSHIFRMEAFFAVAGFLAAISAARQGHGWLARRCTQLAIPLATGWLFIVPLSMIADAHAQHKAVALSPIHLFHLWFLLTLLLLTPIGWLADRKGWLARLTGQADRFPVLFWLCQIVVLGGLVILSRAISHLPGLASDLPRTIGNTPYYGMFYLAGLLAARSQVARDHLATTRWWVIGPLTWAAALVVYAVFNGQVTRPGHWGLHVLNIALTMGAAATMTYAVLATGLRMGRATAPVTMLVRSAFSVYLIHMIPVGITAWYLADRGLSAGAMFLLVAAVSMVVSVAFHELVIRRSPILTLLLNGRLPVVREHAGAVIERPRTGSRLS